MKTILIFFIFLLNFTSFAQSNKIDSLKLILKNASDDNTKIRLYHELYTLSDDIRFVNYGFKLSIKKKNQSGLAIFYRDYGRI